MKRSVLYLAVALFSAFMPLSASSASFFSFSVGNASIVIGSDHGPGRPVPPPPHRPVMRPPAPKPPVVKPMPPHHHHGKPLPPKPNHQGKPGRSGDKGPRR